jgi:hypothetical protein
VIPRWKGPQSEGRRAPQPSRWHPRHDRNSRWIANRTDQPQVRCRKDGFGAIQFGA